MRIHWRLLAELPLWHFFMPCLYLVPKPPGFARKQSKQMNKRLGREFYSQDVLEVAPQLLGKHLVRIYPDGTKATYIITETEAYRGGEDLACHASKGRTPRTEVMFGDGGHLYMYLIYGMYWMLNVVTGM